MRFLLILPNCPQPPDKGEKIRNLAILQSLAKIGTVDALCISNRGCSEQEASELKKYCQNLRIFSLSGYRKFWNFFTALFSAQAFSTAKCYQPHLKKYLQTINYSNFDIVFISSSNLLHTIPLPALPSHKIYWDIIDVDSYKWSSFSKESQSFWKRWLFNREARHVSNNEAQIIEYSQKVFLINQNELNKLPEVMHKKLAVLPACWPELGLLPAKQQQTKTIVFSGNFNYSPNIIASRYLHDQVLPLLSSNTKLLFVGNQATQTLKNSLSKAVFSGAVYDSREAIANATVYVAPLFDFFGSPLKILEAIACHLPIIITGSLAEIYSLENEVNCLIANTPAEFANAIERIFNDQALGNKLASAASLILSKQFSLNNLSSILKTCIQEQHNFTVQSINNADSQRDHSTLATIIMPFYNSAAFISSALEYIANQDHQNFELIAVDDGSIDKSALLLEQITANWKQSVKLVKQRNFGSYAARNRGLELAQGEFIAFYDVDDCWGKNHLSASVAALSSHNIQGVYSDCRLIDLNQQGKVIYESVFRPNNQPHRFLQLNNIRIGNLHIINDSRAAEYQISYGLYMGLQFSVFRKSVFKSYRFESKFRNEAEDQLSVIKLLKSGVKLAYLNESHGDYQIHTSNSSGANQFSTRQRKIALRQAIINGFEQIRPILSKQEDFAIRRRIADEYFWHLGYLLGINHREWLFALNNYLKAIRTWPYNWRFYKSLFLLPAHILRSFFSAHKLH